MLQILSSPIWSFVQAALALLAISFSISVYLKQRKRKKLSYIILSSADLFSVRDEIKGQVKILLNDNPIEDARLLVIKLTNSGNIPIARSDYDQPISLDFGDKARVLSYEVTDKSPDNLPVEVSNQNEQIVLSPLLLNGGDSVIVNVLVSGGEGVSINGRIQGVKEIIGKDATEEGANYSRLSFETYFLVILVFIVIGTAITKITFLQAIYAQKTWWSTSLLLLLFLGLPFLIIKVILKARSKIRIPD